MLRWICRHHHHKLFMVMQDNSLVGTDTSHNLNLDVHPSRVVAALSGINPHEQTGHTPVVLVRVEHLHSLLPDAHFQLDVIMTSLRG